MTALTPSFALVNGRVMTPAGERALAVVVEGGTVRDLTAQAPAGIAAVDLGGGWLLPGFIDTQVNGGGGRLFNDDPSVDTVAVIAQTHRRFGTTGLLPTLISDDLDVVERAIRAVDDAIEAGVPGVLGIHIEGPFLHPARRGIHAADKVRPLEDAFIDLLASARHGRTLVTLAPDNATPNQIARLVARGVIVAGGHSDADYATVRAAIDAGLTGFTHLYNAMSPLTSRAPGMVGAVLEDEGTFAGIIVDGHHLHPAALRVALRAKGAERLMLVTDAMPSAGSDAPGFVLQGRAIRREGDRLSDEAGTLAGSALTMDEAVRQAMAQGRIDLATASRMASASPAAFLRLDGVTGAIAPGLAADLILLGEDLTVQRSWIAGSEAA